MGAVVQFKKSDRLAEMEDAIRTLLNRGVTVEEIKMGSLEALTQLVQKDNPHFTWSQATDHADQFINKLFKKVGF